MIKNKILKKLHINLDELNQLITAVLKIPLPFIFEQKINEGKIFNTQTTITSDKWNYSSFEINVEKKVCLSLNELNLLISQATQAGLIPKAKDIIQKRIDAGKSFATQTWVMPDGTFEIYITENIDLEFNKKLLSKSKERKGI